ncbi:MULTISPECIES: GntR family transcriptional regulator [Glutamicibacter]|nr:GntR family transcriptional regulator [Glutamicibacter sp.]HCJ54398.1 GntR family transcriptional regulator [Glutamicibacter sp.]HCM95910.1 GntR family transcriptional regulator [Glutamicibacter sp.]
MANSISERLTQTLRERINRGELAPGTLVIEPALAQEFEVSKTPVRESLRQLTSEGLLQVLPKKGYLVRAISMNDVYEVLELRSLLEPHVAGQVSAMHSAALIVSLAGHLEAQEKLAVSDPIASMHAAQRFHSELAAASRNSRIVASLENCFTQTARAHYVLPSMQPYMSQSDELSEHQQILAAIQQSDPEAATRAMALHLDSIRRAMLGQA